MCEKLRHFKRIHLNKGEEKEVEFILTKEDWKYIGIDMKPWLPDGKVKVMVKVMEVIFNIRD